MAETNRDEQKCPRCHVLENKLWEASEALRLERIERGERDGFEDYDELLNRFATVCRDMDEGAEIRARINLLPMQTKMAETKARTEKIEAQIGLIEEQKKLAALKVEKQELENQGMRAMIQLYLTAVEAVKRIGAGQAVETDFEVLADLKQIGVKIPPKIKRAAFLLKQTVRARKMRNEKGQFAPRNSFAKGHGAPPGNQNAKGHGAPVRNINAVKTGEFMQFEEDETPYERLRGGETELKVFGVEAGHLLMRASCELTEARERLKLSLSIGN